MEDLLSSEDASIPEPDSVASQSSQSAPPMDLVGDIHSASPLQEATIQESGNEDSVAAPSSQVQQPPIMDSKKTITLLSPRCHMIVVMYIIN